MKAIDLAPSIEAANAARIRAASLKITEAIEHAHNEGDRATFDALLWLAFGRRPAFDEAYAYVMVQA